MKTLLTLLFIAATFPARSATITTLVCTDHVKRTTTVYRNVTVPDELTYLSFEELNDLICTHLKLSKRNNKKGN